MILKGLNRDEFNLSSALTAESTFQSPSRWLYLPVNQNLYVCGFDNKTPNKQSIDIDGKRWARILVIISINLINFKLKNVSENIDKENVFLSDLFSSPTTFIHNFMACKNQLKFSYFYKTFVKLFKNRFLCNHYNSEKKKKLWQCHKSFSHCVCL